MESIIKELWHGNIVPQEDSRTNSKEMKELLGYMSRHHEDLEKSFTDEQIKLTLVQIGTITANNTASGQSVHAILRFYKICTIQSRRNAGGNCLLSRMRFF